MILCEQIPSRSYRRRARLRRTAALHAVQTTRFLHDWLPQSFFTSGVKLELTNLPPDKSVTSTSLAAVGVSGSAASHTGVPCVSVLASSQPGMKQSSSSILGVFVLAASRVGVSDAKAPSPAAVVGSVSAASHVGVPDVSGLAAFQPGRKNIYIKFHISCSSRRVGLGCTMHWSSSCSGFGGLFNQA
jgi:hypothetical protein